ncbi:MAG TPA: amidohydrolase family protein, partial [Anaeromyxobacteraceae bacterium]|nr:amidohydrolase family protein [Anaeromyxobacteraceae bacterium]
TTLLYTEAMDVDRQIAAQDSAGVEQSVLSFSMLLELFSQTLHLPVLEVAKRLNDASAAIVARHPDKLAYLAMVHPFDPRSVRECERCLANGAKGISIGTSWKGHFLDSRRADPLWEFAQDRQTTIFLHPPLIPIGRHRMKTYKLEEIVGRPFDTTMTVTRMIYSGVFDRYPGLKILLPHMGGALPNVLGRLDFGHRLGYEGLPEGQAALCKRRPSEYLRTNLYADTMGFSAAGIRHCLDLFGTDRVLFGTDYPAVPYSPREHVEIVRGMGLPPAGLAQILGGNAAQLFGLSQARPGQTMPAGRSTKSGRDGHPLAGDAA